MENDALFEEFLSGEDTLRVYDGQKLIFTSKKDRLFPLLEYIRKSGECQKKVVIFDKVTGNAAALLSIKAGCREVFSPLCSQIGIDTLHKYNIKYHAVTVVPWIMAPDGNICPMEKLSTGKNPEDFYKLISG
jgi:hypothetical protein